MCVYKYLRDENEERDHRVTEVTAWDLDPDA